MASIAQAFADLQHDVYVLGRGKFDYLFDNPAFHVVEIPFDYEWLTEEKFLQIHDLDQYGLTFVSEQELDRFVQEEVRILREIKPDVVVTGFRPTMSISTKVAKIPLVWVLSGCVADLYAEYELRTMPHGFAKPLKVMRFIMMKISRSLFLRFLNFVVVRKWYGSWNPVMDKYSLPQFTQMTGALKGDFNLMSDAAELFPEFEEIPSYYDFCGPLLPDLKIEPPDSFLDYQKKDGRPVVFLSMGSSGAPGILEDLIRSFAGKPYDVFAATTSILDKDKFEDMPENVIVEPYFPAIELTQMADVAIIHGGQGTVYTTILGGAPFVGVPMFNEQQWNLENVERLGCGMIVPRPEFDVSQVHEAVDTILGNPQYKQNMMELRDRVLKYQTDPECYPPLLAAQKIVRFLDGPAVSYFDTKAY